MESHLSSIIFAGFVGIICTAEGCSSNSARLLSADKSHRASKIQPVFTPSQKDPFQAASEGLVGDSPSAATILCSASSNGAATLSMHNDSGVFNPTIETCGFNEARPSEQTTDGTSEPATQEPIKLTYNQVVFATITEHPAIAAQLESLAQSRADWLTSSLLPNPELFTDAQLLPLTRPFTVNRQGGPPQQDVAVSYPIDWYIFGKRLAAMQAAHSGVHVAQFEYENLIRLRIIEANDAFFNLLMQQELLEANVEVVRNLEKLEKATAQAVTDGGKPTVDLNRVKLDLLSARQKLSVNRSDKRVAQAQLASLLGRVELTDDLQVLFDLDRPLEGAKIDRATAYETALGIRPDMKRLNWLATQAGQNVYLQQRLAKPTIAPSLGYTRQYQEKAIGFPDANSWSASVTMSLPVHDRNQGNIAKAASQQRQSQWQIEALKVEIKAEIETTYSQLAAAESVARSVADEQLQLAGQVRDSITQAFQTGGRPLIDVLDAQRSYRDTLSLYSTTRTEYWKSLYRIYGVIGQSPNEFLEAP